MQSLLQLLRHTMSGTKYESCYFTKKNMREETHINDVLLETILRLGFCFDRTIFQPHRPHPIHLINRKFVQTCIIGIVHEVMDRIITSIEYARIPPGRATIGG